MLGLLGTPWDSLGLLGTPWDSLGFSGVSLAHLDYFKYNCFSRTVLFETACIFESHRFIIFWAEDFVFPSQNRGRLIVKQTWFHVYVAPPTQRSLAPLFKLFWQSEHVFQTLFTKIFIIIILLWQTSWISWTKLGTNLRWCKITGQFGTKWWQLLNR